MASLPIINVPSGSTSESTVAVRAGGEMTVGAQRPFRLTRHFSVTSLLGLLVVLGVLLAFYRHAAMTAIMDQEARANEAITQVFANTLWPTYDVYLGHAGTLPLAEMQTRPEAGLLHDDVMRQMRGLNIAKVKIYDLSGLTVFSTDPKQIGQDKSNNSGFLKAKAGVVMSDITFRDRFDAFEHVINDRNLVSSYVPVRKDDGAPVEAVMEVYSDVTELVQRLETTQWHIVGVVLGSLSLLYLFLYAIARRADRIISAQREEMRITHDAMLRHQASHDALTALPNRASFSERLDLMIKAARRAGTQVAVLSIDVHGLRDVNQSLGHSTGDRLLKEVGARLSRTLREADITARRGGAEFAVAISGIRGIEHVANVAEKIQRAIAGPTYAIDSHNLRVTLNIGIGIHPDDGADGAALLGSADMAMHHAATHGRNNFQFHAPEMNERALAMLLTEQDLRLALERSEFFLHYQPQLHLGSGRLVGVEALIRWQHPTRGLVAPAQFIPIAEERDLIVPIGDWVLREACRQNREWQDAGLPPMPVAVNLSALQFQQKNLAQHIAQMLEDTGLSPHYLELELTESAVMRDADSSIATMRRLKQVGLRLSMDDFGTGYSSLSQLKRVPLDKLKIDQSFVRGLPGDPYDLAISTAIIGMGKALNLTVIAEGVETADQLNVLRSIECNAIQGYYLSRPLAAAACADFSRQRAQAA
ncbi:MAG TPA: bifunctional diguanylate cyclase/phosphodiesterase [Burkholderiales bacterium]|nr:bifunctional diguanylate cyclase/phosphodiesterase [Burkholderiales bacterium]